MVTEATLRGRAGGGGAAGAILVAAMLIALAWRHGGYNASTWVEATVCFACAAAAAVSLRGRVSLQRTEWLMLGALSAFGALLVLSMLWSEAPSDALREGERALLYLAALAAFFLIRPSGRSLLLALAAALTGVVMLSAPIGYANSVGILAALAILLALGVAISETGWLASLALAAVVLLPSSLLTTASRGAWLALACGLLLRVAPDPDRRRNLATLAVVAVPAALGTWIGSAIVLAALAAFTGVFGPRVANRLEGSPWPGRLALVACLTAIAVVIAASPTNPLGEQRPYYWKVAWHDYEAHPLLGSGAGTYALRWQVEQPIPVHVKDAHSLYLETLAEVGPLGLLLVLTVLGAPVVAAVRSRASPMVLTAGPAYAAFIVHAGIDWDWEMPVVTIAGLVCGAALLRSAVRVPLDGAAQESNLPSAGLRRRTGFEDQLGHQPLPLPPGA